MHFEHIRKIKDVKMYTELAQMDGQWVHGLLWNFENHVLQTSFLPLEGRNSGTYMIFTGFGPPVFESLCKRLYMQGLCYISSHISWLRGYNILEAKIKG